MAKVPLQKIRVTGYKKHYKVLMQELHRSGVVDVIENDELIQGSTSEAETYFGVFDLARIDFSIRFLSTYEGPKSKMESLLTGGKMIMGENESRRRVKAFSTRSESVIRLCEELEDKMVRAENELARIPSKRGLLDQLGLFDLPLAEDYSTAQTSTWVGSIQKGKEKEFLSRVAGESNLMDLQVLSRDHTKTYIRVTVYNDLSSQVWDLLTEFGFELLDYMTDLADYEGEGVKEVRSELKRKEKQLIQQLQGYEKEAEELSSNLEDLRILYDYNLWWKRKNDLQHKIFRSEYLFAFEGWLPKAEYAKLEKWLKNTFVGEVVVEKLKLAKGEEPPVLLSNEMGVASFEPLVEMYGLPKAKEFDPTPWMSVAFVIFFGTCLSDVGYGSILAGAALFFILFGKFSREAKQALGLLLICGTSAIVGGVLLGGYFGLTPDQVPEIMTHWEVQANGEAVKVFRGQILNPMAGSGSINFLLTALAFGVVQLLLGVALDFAKRISNKDYMGAICDPGAWFFFLLMIVGFGLSDQLGLDKALFGKLTLVGAGILMVTQSRDQKNWLLKPFSGLLGLYGVTAYLSDLLSYSRLMALGLATGVVGFAMNMTGGIIGDMVGVPYVGTVVAVVIIVLGHSLNMVLSLLGAFIHTGRLQFIEFFGKFYEGGGTKFNPFRRESKYLRIKVEKE